jgi:TetR/AcrR family transcriptional regulator
MVKTSRSTNSAFEHDGDTEQRILDAAHSVFLRYGTAGARMQEIADEARVNKALLHYYFRNKERLAEAVFQRFAIRIFAPLLALINSELPIPEKVKQVVHWELDHLIESPLLPGYIISELHQNPERVRQFATLMTGVDVQIIAPQMIETVRRQIAEAVEAGTMRPISPEQFIVNLMSLCVFPFALKPMITMIFGFGDNGFDQFIQQRRTEVISFFLQALRP